METIISGFDNQVLKNNQVVKKENHYYLWKQVFEKQLSMFSSLRNILTGSWTSDVDGFWSVLNGIAIIERKRQWVEIKQRRWDDRRDAWEIDTGLLKKKVVN